MATLDVIKSLRRKIDDRYEASVPIGVEQRFVSPLRGTTNNNLEEQLLLGTDLITTSYWLGSTLCETIEYRKASVNTGYYILERRKYNAAADAQFIHETLVFSTNAVSFEVNVGGNDKVVVLESDLVEFAENDTMVTMPSMFDDDPTNDGLDEEGYRKTLEEVLYYKNTSGNKVEVAVRITSEKEDGGMTYTKSVLENKI